MLSRLKNWLITSLGGVTEEAHSETVNFYSGIFRRQRAEAIKVSFALSATKAAYDEFYHRMGDTVIICSPPSFERVLLSLKSQRCMGVDDMVDSCRYAGLSIRMVGDPLPFVGSLKEPGQGMPYGSVFFENRGETIVKGVTS